MGLRFYIKGIPVEAPKEWQNTEIEAAFGDNSDQPEVEFGRFTLYGTAADMVIDSVRNGDIFQEIPAKIEIQEADSSFVIFDGFLDTSDEYEEVEVSFGSVETPKEIQVKFKSKSSVSNFLDRIEGVTYGFLESQGAITSSDYTTIKTAIVKKAPVTEIALSLISIYILSKQVSDTIKELGEEIPDLVQRTTTSIATVPPTPIGVIIYKAALALVQVAYAISLIAILIKLVLDLIELLIPPIVKNKGCKFRTLLSKACEFYGYTFVSPIEELDIYHYLPSKPYSNSTSILDGIIPQNVPTSKGIPSPSDFGYLIPEMFEICKRLFYAKVDIKGNEVHLRNFDDPYWKRNSTFTPAINVNLGNKKYNTQDLFQTRLFSFLTDPSDTWTIENYTGTSFEVKTEPKKIQNRNAIPITGLERVDIPLALPNVKTKLSVVEEVVISLATVGDSLARLIGQSGNLVSRIERDRINVLKTSTNEHTIAKIVPLVGGKLPSNHRDILSAKALVLKYRRGQSFANFGSKGQKAIYENVTMPFTLSDFQKTLKSGTFTLPDGREAQFREIPQWLVSDDKITASIQVSEVYTNKLKEFYYEP
jgi:hypothetical protein